MDYPTALEWLYGRQALGIKLGLDKVHALLERLGNPQEAFQSIHVAGTNGKGSVCALVAAALGEAGHKVGVFTSPHLVRFTERMVIDGEEIAPEAVAKYAAQLQPIAADLDAAETPPTFFELVTAMAFLHFRDQGVGWAVIETGMGGRLDATNVLAPALCIITNVGMDHQRFLGDHIVDIAAEKAGIMKPGVPCITGAQAEPLLALKATSHALHSPMAILGEDYHVIPDVNGFQLASPTGAAHYDLGLAGEHQLHNAALAVMACDALRARGTLLPMEAVHRGIASVIVPGRLETLAAANGIPVLLDGAHNVDGAVALRRHFAHHDMGGFHLIVGFSADKDWETMLNQWAPLAAFVHGVPLRNTRGLDPAVLAGSVEGIGIPFTAHGDVAAAIDAALSAGADQVVVAGSLFLVAEARATLRGEPLEDVRGDQ